jgi:hypothetical protein
VSPCSYFERRKRDWGWGENEAVWPKLHVAVGGFGRIWQLFFANRNLGFVLFSCLFSSATAVSISASDSRQSSSAEPPFQHLEAPALSQSFAQSRWNSLPSTFRRPQQHRQGEAPLSASSFGTAEKAMTLTVRNGRHGSSEPSSIATVSSHTPSSPTKPVNTKLTYLLDKVDQDRKLLVSAPEIQKKKEKAGES